MKKIFYFAIVTLMLLPLTVKAETNYEEIHNRISPDNNLSVSSIPIEYYRNSGYYKQCVGNNNVPVVQQSCMSYIYSVVVESYLNKTIEKEDGVRFFVNNCDLENNTCEINVSNEAGYLAEQYNITFTGTYNEQTYQKSQKAIEKFESQYYLADMSYINQLINYESEVSYHSNIIYNSYKIFKIFPELKEELEKNKHYKYVPVTMGVGASPILYGSGGLVVLYDNDVAVNISNEMFYNTVRVVYVPDTTENSDERYIEAATNRINEYINNDNYSVTIETDQTFIDENVGEQEWDVSREFNHIFHDQETYTAKLYKLTLNDKEYLIGILPVSQNKIKKLDIKSTNHQTGINVETSSSDIPLDTSVEADDVTEIHKKDGFIKAYDINLFSDLKEEYIKQIQDGIIVRIPMEDGFDKEFVDIYHIKEDGTKGEKYEAKIEIIDNKKYAVFTTNHFSTYAIEEIKTDNSLETTTPDIENPNTYDGIYNSLTLFLLSLLGFITTKKYLKTKESN